jgi:endonuclease/exonuclease/phosphatase family metal-dependent hydrolase
MALEPPPAIGNCHAFDPVTTEARWLSPSDPESRNRLRSWCDAVGPVVVHDPAPAQAAHTNDSVILVSWNMAVGKGDLVTLIEELRREHPHADIILLLQEAYRSETPPSVCPPGSTRAKSIGQPRPPGREDVVSIAERTGMYAVYAPSMRNGHDCAAEPREDRGNAILSTLPLFDVAIVELPFSQQRRVAVAARAHVSGHDTGLVSVHFDTRHGHGSAAAAIVQSVSLLGWQPNVVIAGDLNSYLPFDRGIAHMRSHFTELNCGRGPTHDNDARLDHIFIGRQDAPFPCRTGTERYGSGDSPVIATVPAGNQAMSAGVRVDSDAARKW